MKKIYIIGIVASGKTTLAKRLSLKLNIPWYELDAIVYPPVAECQPKRTAEEQVEIIQRIDREGAWIFEGTERKSYACLFEMADTIVFLDPPLWKRKLRILIRFMKQKLGIEKCNYRPNWTMLKKMYIWTQNFERERSLFDQKLRNYGDKVIHISGNADLDKLVPQAAKSKL